MNTNEIFSKVINHMRAQGNPWGSFMKRNWSYVNPENPCERCARGILMGVYLNEQTGSYLVRKDGYVHGTNYDLVGRELTNEEIILLNALEFNFEHTLQAEWEQQFLYLSNKHNLDLPPKPTHHNIETKTGETTNAN